MAKASQKRHFESSLFHWYMPEDIHEWGYTQLPPIKHLHDPITTNQTIAWPNYHQSNNQTIVSPNYHQSNSCMIQLQPIKQLHDPITTNQTINCMIQWQSLFSSGTQDWNITFWTIIVLFSRVRPVVRLVRQLPAAWTPTSICSRRQVEAWSCSPRETAANR